MTLSNSSPALGENIKSGFARLAENLRFLAHEAMEVRDQPELAVCLGQLAARCEGVADGVPPRSDAAEQKHREWIDNGMRMRRQRDDLLAVLFSPEEKRRELFDWLCEHSDVPELYRSDYAGV